MSADAASLPCPICSHTGVFESVQSLRDRLISVSTNKILCPVCQDEISGLDKLTIHLFSHVKLITPKGRIERCENADPKCKTKSENQVITKTTKKPKPSTAKNKSLSAVNTSVKFVKIYPKLPVISLNTLPVIDISRGQPGDECVQAGNPIYVPTVKTEASLIQTNTNTTCNVCGLQFVDTNILRMHRCLIHNIEDNSNQVFTRYNCHLCPKNFKMRGSLMVHLRVAHYGFTSNNIECDSNSEKNLGGKNTDQFSDDKLVNLERNDNKQWQCDVCRKCFTTKYFLKKHKRLHTGETPYACSQCNKTFTFQQSYHKHLLYHNDEKPHTCNYCGRAFKELSTLHNHQRIHTGEKPFSCETCGKCFRQRVSYLVHKRIHTGVMPYKCTACEKNFRYKVSQRTHKCQAQPPGTVVRRTGDLLEKLKKKHVDSDLTATDSQDNLQTVSDYNDKYIEVESKFPEISEANAELVLRGAKLSLEDMESENFTLLTEHVPENNNNHDQQPSSIRVVTAVEDIISRNDGIFDSNIEDLIDSIPLADKGIPSPSEILKNLCLSKEDDYIGILQDTPEVKSYDISKEFNIFL